MKRFESMRKDTKVPMQQYSTPQLKQYGSVAQLTQGNASHRKTDSGNACFAGSVGNKGNDFCGASNVAKPNSNAPAKRRTK